MAGKKSPLILIFLLCCWVSFWFSLTGVYYKKGFNPETCPRSAPTNSSDLFCWDSETCCQQQNTTTESANGINDPIYFWKKVKLHPPMVGDCSVVVDSCPLNCDMCFRWANWSFWFLLMGLLGSFPLLLFFFYGLHRCADWSCHIFPTRKRKHIFVATSVQDANYTTLVSQ
jgi:hypothetical protein